MNVKPKSPVRELYTKVPFPIDFRIYVFNLTNRDEVHKGKKLKSNVKFRIYYLIRIKNHRIFQVESQKCKKLDHIILKNGKKNSI